MSKMSVLGWSVYISTILSSALSANGQLKNTSLNLDQPNHSSTINCHLCLIQKVVQNNDQNDSTQTPYVQNIEQKLFIDSSEFANYANFTPMRFKKEALFQNCSFSKGVTFAGSNVEQRIVFVEVAFHGGSDFNYSDFYSAIFSDCKFDSNANFESTKFRKLASFDESEFRSNVSFHKAKFYNNIDFRLAAFKSTLSLDQIDLLDSATLMFDDSFLPDTLYLSHIPFISSKVDLLAADFNDPKRYDSATKEYKDGEWHYINLYRSDISKIRLDYFHFKLLLTDGPRGHPLAPDEAKTVYDALLKNFKDAGQEDSYELLDIEYNDYKIKHSQYSFLRWGWVIPHYWNMYGYNKALVFLWALGFLLLFSTITFCKLNRLNDEKAGVYNIEKIPAVSPIFPLTWFALRNIPRRVWFSIVYTCCIFFLFSLKIEKIRFQRVWGSVYLIMVYTTGIVCLGYIANFILQK